MRYCKNALYKRQVDLCPIGLLLAVVIYMVRPFSAYSVDVSLSVNVTGEEQQVNQAGLIFNNAVPGQPFPTAQSYFASIRVTAGRRQQYSIIVANPDTGSASNDITVAGFLSEYVTILPGSLVTNPNTIRCNVGVLGDPTEPLVCNVDSLAAATPSASTTATITFEALVGADTPAGAVVTSGFIASVSNDVNSQNNVAITLSTVLNASDMTVALRSLGTVSIFNQSQGRIVDTTAINSATAGNSVRYRVELQNNGPSSARSGLVKHTLPADFAFSRVEGEGVRCLPSADASNVVYCAVDGMSAGTRQAYDLIVDLNPFALAGTSPQGCIDSLHSGSNTVPPGAPQAVTFDPPLLPLNWDPVVISGNNACVNTGISSFVDAAVSFAAGSLSADERGALSYVPLVSNTGRSGILSGNLNLSFPAGIVPLGASLGCSVEASSATCAVPPLSPGETASFNVVGSLELVSTSATALAVSASLAGITPADGNSSNDGTTALTVVSPRFDNTENKVVLTATSGDFEVQRGSWGVNENGEFFSLDEGTARALVRESTLPSFTSGTLQTAVRLVNVKKSRPGAGLVFAMQEDGSYRFVRLERRGTKGRVVIGQRGVFGGESAGIKAQARFPIKLRKVFFVTVEADSSGTVAVRINNSSEPVVSHTFVGGARAGRAGFEAKRARTVYDNLTILLPHPQ